MKRALKKRVKAVLKNNSSSDDAPVEHLNVNNPKVQRRARTQAAMIGLAISMGATSLLVTRQSDQAQAAAPVGSQKAASTIPAASETEVKFTTTKLESQAVSTASVPENPVIVEPTAVSQVPGLEAKWQIAANSMAVPVPGAGANSSSTVAKQNAIYLQPQVAPTLSKTPVVIQTAKQPEAVQQFTQTEDVASNATTPVTVPTANTASGEVNAQLKAQQEFALNRLQEKSNRLRNSLAELRSGESKTLSPAGNGLAQPTTVVENTVVAQSESSADAKQTKLISQLKQNRETNAATQPNPVAASTSTAYEVKPGDTLAAIASSHGTSVSELAKANNLSNPNQLQISQKLIIPAANVERRSFTQQTVAIQPPGAQSSSPSPVTTSPANAASFTANLPAVSQPLVPSSVTIPTPVAENNQTQINTVVTPETVPAPVANYGMGGDTPVPTAFSEMRLAQKPTRKVAKAKSTERLRSLQAEIERLREKYRAQQSGVIVPEAKETDSQETPIAAGRADDFAASQPNWQRNAVSIPVPRPILPGYNTQPVKPQFRALNSPSEPVNPEFLTNQGTRWTPSTKPAPTRLATPPRGINASDSLGRMRGTTVSPQLPPLAAVDQYLPKPIDETTTFPSSSTTAYIWPAKGVLTSGYGWRWGRMHKGIDIANSTGTPIYASAAGVVERAGWNNGGYGNLVDIRHPDGSLTRYGHNSRILVQAGQQVQQGQTIATMGSTGFSTGPHSHFEVHRSGKGAVNPIAFLPDRL